MPVAISTTTVLGGGISGLSAAYYLGKRGIPSISVYEAKQRLGGWIKTEKQSSGLYFETGPRTIRPVGIKGKNTLKLIEDLKLSNEIKPINRDHAAAKNRMICVNNKLCLLPNNPMGLIKKIEPFSKPLIFSILNDFNTGRSKKPLTDESIYSFFERRFGTEMAKYLISPMICGICAGDATKISVKFLMEDIFEKEQKYGGVIRGAIYSFFNKEKLDDKNISMDSNLSKRSINEKWSIYSFKNGLQTLPDKLSNHLIEQNVNISSNSECTELQFNSDGKIHLKLTNNPSEEIKTDHLFSSIPSYKLANLVNEQHPELANELNDIEYVDVAVVNLQYDSGDLLKIPGFGFLVPPSENLPILGVIYDSCCFDMNGKTVLTVMMGGAWFKQKFGHNPINKDIYDIATSEVGRILKITEKPSCGRVNILEKCIPQYVVGHHDRVKRIRKYIHNNKLPISLCGAAYDGVGVNDVIYSAKNCVNSLNI